MKGDPLLGRWILPPTFSLVDQFVNGGAAQNAVPLGRVIAPTGLEQMEEARHTDRAQCLN